MGTLKGTTIRVREPGAMAMKRFSTFPKSPKLEPHHQMVWCLLYRGKEEIHWNRVNYLLTEVVQSDKYYEVHSINFQTFSYGHWKLSYRLLKIQYAIAIHLIRWLANYYDFTFKGTATAAIGIYPTKVWLLQLVNFKNAIWTWGHFRRTICNKIPF